MWGSTVKGSLPEMATKTQFIANWKFCSGRFGLHTLRYSRLECGPEHFEQRAFKVKKTISWYQLPREVCTSKQLNRSKDISHGVSRPWP